MLVGDTDDLTVSGGAAILTSTIATKPIKFSSTGVTGTECWAVNPTSTSATLMCKALVFSGVTVSGEAATGCSTPTTITTKELTGVIGMGGAGTKETLKIQPKVRDHLRDGRTHRSLRQRGSLQSHRRRLRGSSQSDRHVRTNPNLKVSEAIQKSAGTATSLKFGENGAFINGSLEGKENGGKPWGSKEN